MLEQTTTMIKNFSEDKLSTVSVKCNDGIKKFTTTGRLLKALQEAKKNESVVTFDYNGYECRVVVGDGTRNDLQYCDWWCLDKAMYIGKFKAWKTLGFYNLAKI